MELRATSLHSFRQELEPLLTEHPGGAVVFDADGTLWSHDVGCMVFDFCVENALFRAEALEALAEVAAAHGVALGAPGDVNQVASDMQSAFYRGRIDEKLTAEIQVWAYAGLTETEFRDVTAQALTEGHHQRGLHSGVVELADWVRRQGGTSFIVSASPRWVVEVASASLGFSKEHIAAGDPCLRSSDGQTYLAPQMALPLPYGPDKVVAGRSLIGNRPWLAALGDSAFDLDMFRSAKLAGGIGNKQSMLEGLVDIPHGYHLEPPL